MTGEARGCPALGEAIVFLSYFEDLPDTRQAGKVMYPLDEVLLLCLLAVLAGAETITDIARFGQKKLGLCAGFGPLPKGHRRMTTLATSSPLWTPNSSNAVSWPGWRP